MHESGRYVAAGCNDGWRVYYVDGLQDSVVGASTKVQEGKEKENEEGEGKGKGENGAHHENESSSSSTSTSSASSSASPTGSAADDYFDGVAAVDDDANNNNNVNNVADGNNRRRGRGRRGGAAEGKDNTPQVSKSLEIEPSVPLTAVEEEGYLSLPEGHSTHTVAFSADHDTTCLAIEFVGKDSTKILVGSRKIALYDIAPCIRAYERRRARREAQQHRERQQHGKGRRGQLQHRNGASDGDAADDGDDGNDDVFMKPKGHNIGYEPICLRVFEGHTGSVMTFALDMFPYAIVSGGRDGAVKIWDAETGTCIHSYVFAFVMSRKFSCDWKLLNRLFEALRMYYVPFVCVI